MIRVTSASCLGASVLFVCMLNTRLWSQEEASDPLKAIREAIQSVELELPSDDSSELATFLENTKKSSAELNQEFRTLMTKLASLQTKAAEKIIAQADDISNDTFYAAAQFALAPRVANVPKASEEEQQKTYALVKRQFAIGLERGPSTVDLYNASRLGSYLEQAGRDELALEAFQLFADQLKDKGDKNFQQWVESFASSARRLALLGSTLELEGKLLDGSELDWNAYRGKVVLVDFWATWCGPCIAEAPNVRRYYDLYHDQGFEVVGISLDTKQEALEAYIEKEQVPWVNLFESGAGWKHSMAVRYGIRAIPSVFLVDTEGKVVSLEARGSELGKQLEKLMGPPTKVASGLAAEGDWKGAAAAMQPLIQSEPTNAIYRLAQGAAFLTAKDREGFRDACRTTYSAFEKSDDHWGKSRFAWMGCLARDPGVSREIIDRFASESLKQFPDKPHMQLIKAMSLYRLEDYEACISQAPEGVNPLQSSLSLLFRAMSAHHLGRQVEAQAWLASGRAIVQDAFATADGKKPAENMPEQWIGYAISHLALAEAQSLVEP